MLNRRNLRIKVMQSLFSLQQCKDANYELGIEGFGEIFTPDLNSMEVQDKVLLNNQKKQSAKMFEKAFEKGDTSIDHDDVKVKKAVNNAFLEYDRQVRKDTNFFLKSLISDVEKIYEHYISVLNLVAVFGEVAEADKKFNHKNFVENAWIKAVRESEALQKDALKLNRDWRKKLDQVRLWFRDVVRQDAEYQNYLDKKTPSVDDQKEIYQSSFKKDYTW